MERSRPGANTTILPPPAKPIPNLDFSPQPSASDHNALLPGRVPHVRRLRRTWAEYDGRSPSNVLTPLTKDIGKNVIFNPRTPESANTGHPSRGGGIVVVSGQSW